MRHLPDYGITFIHNPKTAGTSMATWLDHNFKTVKGRRHGNHNEVWEFFPNTKWCFGVVRNPWDRLASWYHMLREPCTFEDFLYTRLYTNHSSLSLSFQPRINWAGVWYNITTPQYDWFGESTNYIFKYEEIDEQFEYLQTILDCDKPLPYTNKSIDFDYRTMYNDDTAELVRDIFLKDVIEYNYEF